VLLFLDFDGVLHHDPIVDTAPGAVCNARDFSYLPLFEDVMRDFIHIDIVISSAWRQTNSLETLRRFFSADIAARIIGVTPVLPSNMDARREREIRLWLHEAKREHESFIAVDDWPALFSEGCNFLFYVNPETAFDATTADALRHRLNALMRQPGSKST
jgi:hypothetical protein